MLHTVASTIRKGQLLASGDRVAVAVSGGSDSVALLWLLHEFQVEAGVAVVGLIHVNHLLRGDDADADEQFCRALAHRLGLPADVARIDVGALASTRRCSIEVAARDARYQFFAEAASRLDAGVVATGHTLDDQAETVLLRLMRGAGTRGLSGIRLRRDPFIRPLLDCRREDLRRYLTARREAWREDASNADVRIVRNRVRRELIPLILDIAPGAVRALARLASHAAEDEAVLMQVAGDHRGEVVVSSAHEDAATLDAAALAVLPPAIARRLVRMVAAEVAPGQALSGQHLAAVCSLAAARHPSGRLDLPGLAVEKQGDTLRVVRRVVSAGTPSAGWPDRLLAVPGSVVVPEAGVEIEAEAGLAGPGGWATTPSSTMVRTASVRLPLFVRNRRRGDRVQPLGAPGRRKLQDLLVDRKVPRGERDRVPVVVDSDGHIVWVVGLAVAEPCRVESPEDGVLLLKQRKRE